MEVIVRCLVGQVSICCSCRSPRPRADNALLEKAYAQNGAILQEWMLEWRLLPAKARPDISRWVVCDKVEKLSLKLLSRFYLIFNVICDDCKLDL